MGSTDSLECYC